MVRKTKESKNKSLIISTIIEGQLIGDDLCKLAELLIKYDICGDTGQIDSAGKECKKKSNENGWSYNSTVNINLNAFGKSYPFDHKDISVQLIVKLVSEKLQTDKIYDPIKILEFDIVLTGKSDIKGELIACWHLDKHPIHSGNDSYSHPKYHFTFGGKYLPPEKDYGSLLILNTPRLFYPPMDLILGIDFVIQNYIDMKKSKPLLNDSNYKQIINNSQVRLWKPYFQSIYSKWSNEYDLFHPEYQFDALKPFLFKDK